MKKIDEVVYDKVYVCENSFDGKVELEFTKDENRTWMNITVFFHDGQELDKKILLTQEDEIDEFDVANVNKLLNEQKITFVEYREKENA